jgi:NAD-dependent deacetylase
MSSVYNDVADLILRNSNCVALTGAGISAESGIPTFRSKGGLWEKYDPFVYASIEMFQRDPSKYWSIRGEFIRDYDSYQPNEGHIALAELERLGLLRSIITQNIDGLHRKAGSKNVIEIHGSLREIFCVKCGKEYQAPDIPDEDPPYCACGGVLKPNTVLFGEQLPQEALMNAQHESQTCGVMLLIGTSAAVYPAASLPFIARQNNARIIEINIERSFEGADFYIEEKSGIALPEILRRITSLTHT